MKTNKMLIFSILISMFLCGCGYDSERKAAESESINLSGIGTIYYKIVVIDSHEYIASSSYGRPYVIGAHKADCKFCKDKHSRD